MTHSKTGRSAATLTVVKTQRPTARLSSRAKILHATTDQIATGIDAWMMRVLKASGSVAGE